MAISTKLCVLSLLVMALSAAVLAGPRSIGCFKDKAKHPDFKLKGISSRNSRTNCVKACKMHFFKYAAMQGSLCFCGDSYGRYGKAKANDCKLPCRGNAKETCGGKLRNEVYATGAKSLKSLGCFKDKKGKPEFGRRLVFKTHVIKWCVTYCRMSGSKYAAVQAGNKCQCGNSYGRYGKAKASECDQPCVGDRMLTCGGKLRNEVFSTKLRS